MRVYLRGYGWRLAPSALTAFATATGLMPDRVSQMLLSRYDGIAFESQGGASPWRSAGQRNLWILWTTSRMCPSCIAEAPMGVWYLRWKLGWSFACVLHKRLLVETCPTCRQALGARIHAGGPLFFGRVPTPGLCMNSAGTRPRGGYRSPMCGQALGELESQRLAQESPVIAAQREIDAVLDRARLNTSGPDVTPLMYFQDVKRICAMILLVAEPVDFGDLPQSLMTAVEGHVAEREKMLRRCVADHDGGAPKILFHRNGPQGPELMGAVASLAVRIRAEVPSDVWLRRDREIRMMQFARDRWPLVLQSLGAGSRTQPPVWGRRCCTPEARR
jgi:hypothetical protein